jgi:hypothetical protein
MAWKERLREQMAVEFANAEILENAVKKIMGESGLPTWHNIPYLNFGRQVYKLYRRFGGQTLKNEVALLIRLSQKKQLKYRLLIKIRDAIYELFEHAE